MSACRSGACRSAPLPRSRPLRRRQQRSCRQSPRVWPRDAGSRPATALGQAGAHQFRMRIELRPVAAAQGGEADQPRLGVGPPVARRSQGNIRKTVAPRELPSDRGEKRLKCTGNSSSSSSCRSFPGRAGGGVGNFEADIPPGFKAAKKARKSRAGSGTCSTLWDARITSNASHRLPMPRRSLRYSQTGPLPGSDRHCRNVDSPSGPSKVPQHRQLRPRPAAEVAQRSTRHESGHGKVAAAPTRYHPSIANNGFGVRGKCR